MPATYLSLHVHIIFATNGRAPMILDPWRSDLHAYIGGTVRGLGAQPVAVGGVADHVHMLVGLRGTHCAADLVREVKKASFHWAATKERKLEWQTGYGAFAVSPSDVKRVIT